MKRVRVYISGTVQGVYFRESTRTEAGKYAVTGWVRNMPDGRVEALFEGAPFAVDTMVQWCHQGPPGARVRFVEALEETATGEFRAFEVRR